MKPEDKQIGREIIAISCHIVSYFGLCMKCDKKILCCACRTVIEEIRKLENKGEENESRN